MFDVRESTRRPWASGQARRSGRPRSRSDRGRRRAGSRPVRAVAARGPHRPNLGREPGAALPCVERVPLDLARSDRWLGQASVPEEDRVPGVLPALVRQPLLGVPTVIGDEAGGMLGTALVDPGECRASLRFERLDERRVTGPALVFVEQYKEQRRSVSSPVIRRVGRLAEDAHLAAPELVKDLARLCVALHRRDGRPAARRADAAFCAARSGRNGTAW